MKMKCLIPILVILFASPALAQDTAGEPDTLGSESCPITEYEADPNDWGYEPEDWYIYDAANGEDGGGDGPVETDPGTMVPTDGEPACLEKKDSTFLKIVYLSCTTPWGDPGLQKCWKYRDDFTYVPPAGRTTPCQKPWSQIRYSCSPACIVPSPTLEIKPVP